MSQSELAPCVGSLDHLVLTVGDIARTEAFYQSVLGKQAQQVTPADRATRWALTFGVQKINLHQVGPIERTGATGPILSHYVRDPDRNLIEISTGV